MTSNGTGTAMESGSEAVRLTNVDIDNALENNHFQVIFQPIFHLGTGALLRVESFVRWTHPGLGVLPPGAFISFFESQGRMGELTRHVLTTALDAYVAWRGTDGPGFSVNLAQSDLIEPDFAEWFTGLLAERAFPAGLVTLECPALPTDVSLTDASRYFSRLEATGARLAMEVRGRANDLLRTIDPFPFDEIKTGGSAILRFARTMRGGPGLSAISELLELAKANEADIVAVGVEDQASLKALAGLGFTAAQGNYLATIGDLDAIADNIVDSVREVLELPALAEDAPAAAELADSVDAPETNVEAVETASTASTLSAEKVALLKQKAARVAAKRRAERKAAGARQAVAGGTAEPVEVIVEDDAVSETGEDERQALADAAARREAEENARRLQSRLAQAYETPRVEAESSSSAETTEQPSAETADTPPAPAVKRPATRASGQASKVTHRSAASDATTKPAPAPADEPAPAAKPKAKPTTARAEARGEATAPPATEPEAPVAEKPATEPAVETPEPVAENTATVPAAQNEDPDATRADRAGETPAPKADEPASRRDRDTPPSLSRIGMTSSLQLTGIADLPADAESKEKTVSKAPEREIPDAGVATSRQDEAPFEPEQSAPEVTGIIEEFEEEMVIPAAAKPAAREEEEETIILAGDAESEDDEPELIAAETIREIWTEADPEEFRSEDEVLDDAFAGTAELDPTDSHPDESEGPVELNSTEREIAGRLRNRPHRRRKNWLMRKHRIWPTHFWPVSWKRKWQAKKARTEMRTYVIEPGSKVPRLSDDN